MWQIQAVEILGLLPYFGSNGVFLLVLQPSAAGYARSFTADRVQTAAGGCRRHLVSSPREIRAETPWPLALLVLYLSPCPPSLEAGKICSCLVLQTRRGN